MDIFEKFFQIWNLWGPMHLSINVWSWSGKKSESWYSLMGIDNIDHIQQDFCLINNFISINNYYSTLKINVLCKKKILNPSLREIR